MDKARVYLAGPISGCNEEQRHTWRDELRSGFSEEFDFIDPSQDILEKGDTDFEVVQADTEAIKTADAVLANMWRESIGTSIGILHAHMAGKIVCVCDPNYINNRMLAFYADSVHRSIPATVHAIRTFLKSESLIKCVVKTDGSEERFDRQKLSMAIRKACIEANAGDVVPTRAIVSKTLSLLMDDQIDERELNSSDIEKTVWEALAELAADPLHEADYDAIRRAWEVHGTAQIAPKGKKKAIIRGLTPVVHEKPLQVPIRSQGTHKSMWGPGKIGKDALSIFFEMCRVEGIIRIMLGPFTNNHNPPAKPHTRLQASRQPHNIDGKLYDKAKYGTIQTFQVHVANPEQRDLILDVLRSHLTSLGHIRPTQNDDR